MRQDAHPYLFYALLWLVGWCLRVPMLAAPPLSTYMAESYDLGEAGIAALTMIPVLTVAFGAIPAAWLIIRFGLRVCIVGGILIMVVASVMRGYMPASLQLFGMSAIMGFGIALFQTALPAAARVWTPNHIAMGSAVYLNGMMVGEFSGAGLTLPVIMPLAGQSWQMALILWSVPIVLIAILVLFSNLSGQDTATQPETPDHDQTSQALPQWKNKHLWRFGLLLAATNVIFFSINAFAAQILAMRGEGDRIAYFFMGYNAMPLMASFVILGAPRWIGYRNPLAVTMGAAVFGHAGFFFFEGWAAWMAAMVAGLTGTMAMILLVALPSRMCQGAAVTRLSAGMTLVGYFLAFLVSILGGLVAEWVGRSDWALLPVLIFALCTLPLLGREKTYSRD